MSMLTIKHVEKSGHEGIQMAHGVSVSKGPNNTKAVEAFGCTGIGGAVDESGHCTYGTGKVYVMNDAGATVGFYDLD